MKISIDELAFCSDQIIATQDVDRIASLLEEITSIKKEEFNELEWAYLHFIEANIYLALRSIKHQAVPLSGCAYQLISVTPSIILAVSRKPLSIGITR